jgi:hypothetical protein
MYSDLYKMSYHRFKNGKLIFFYKCIFVWQTARFSYVI